jgi:hypothetical protein
MADHFEKANKSIRGMYNVFQKGAGQGINGQSGVKDVNRIRARLVGENILTLGLSNVVRLGVAYKNTKSNEIKELINNRISTFACSTAATYGLDSGDLTRWLQYLYDTQGGTSPVMPDPNPCGDPAFLAGWEKLTDVYGDILQRFRGGSAALPAD